MGVSYVETDSMKPTLQPGDGFVLLPKALSSPPESGDVIVFRAQNLGGGGLTTHRVVGETNRGYITQGDNNNAPDQAGSEPPVKQAQIVGQPLQVGGKIVVLPQIRSAVTVVNDVLASTRANIILLLGSPEISQTQFRLGVAGGLFILYVLESLRDKIRVSKRSKSTQRNITREYEDGYSLHTILLGLTAIVILATTMVMVVPSGPEKYNIGVGRGASDNPNLASPGERVEFTHGIGGSSTLPLVVHVKGGAGVDVTPKQVELQRGETANISATAQTPSSIGYHQFFVVEQYYLPLLPADVLIELYQIHPWLPIIIIDLIVAIPYYVISRYMLPEKKGRTRLRSRERSP